MADTRFTALAAIAIALAWPGAGMAQGASAQASATGPNGRVQAQSSSQLSRGDRKMVEDLIEANVAEIQTGRMALQKAQSPQAKQFAQKMIDDHTQALQQVRDLAQAKGMQPGDDTDLMHKAMAKGLDSLSGDRFDLQYMKRVGVSDHERTVRLLQKMQRDARDSEVKSLASAMLPKVQQHLQMAREDVARMSGSRQQTANR